MFFSQGTCEDAILLHVGCTWVKDVALLLGYIQLAKIKNDPIMSPLSRR